MQFCAERRRDGEGYRDIRRGAERGGAMKPFSTEAAEKVISLLCYSRSEDTYYHGPQGKRPAVAGTFRLAVVLDQGAPRIALCDIYDPTRYRTTTVEAAIQQGLLAPSWEDLATKLSLNDQDILYMGLMNRADPVRAGLNEVRRVIAYRDEHSDRPKAARITCTPHRPNGRLRSLSRSTGNGLRKRASTDKPAHKRAKAS
jgi:hypothetical protein